MEPSIHTISQSWEASVEESQPLTGGGWSLVSLHCFSCLGIFTLMASHCECTWILVPCLTFLGQCFFSGQQLIGEEFKIPHLLDRARMEQVEWAMLLDFPWWKNSQPLLGTRKQCPLLSQPFPTEQSKSFYGTEKQKESAVSSGLQSLPVLT